MSIMRKRIVIAFFEGFLELQKSLEALYLYQKHLEDVIHDSDPCRRPEQISFGAKQLLLDRSTFGGIGGPLHEIYAAYAKHCAAHIDCYDKVGDGKIHETPDAGFAYLSENVRKAIYFFCTDNEHGIRFGSGTGNDTSYVLTPEELQSDDYSDVYNMVEEIIGVYLTELSDDGSDDFAPTDFDPSSHEDTKNLLFAVSDTLAHLATEMFFDDGASEVLKYMKIQLAIEESCSKWHPRQSLHYQPLRESLRYQPMTNTP